MHDKEKIRIMSKMAVYDKRGFDKDAKANQYFRHDYIYKRNMSMRFFLGFGCLILIFFYALHLLAIEDVDIFTLDFGSEALTVLIFALAVMVAYSFIGTIVFTREFLRSQKRIAEYFSLMKQLEERNIAKEKQNAHSSSIYDDFENDEEDFERYEPYRPRGRDGAEYRYRTTGDPEFWEDDDKKDLK